MTAVPAPPREVRLSIGEGKEPEVDFSAPSARAQVVDAHGNGVPYIALTFQVLAGGGTVPAEPMYTDENGDVLFTWIMGPDAGAANTVAATVVSLGHEVTGVPVSLTVYPAKADFDLEVLYDRGLSASSIVREVVEAAKKRWESIIRGDIRETTFDRSDVAACNRKKSSTFQRQRPF